MTLLDRVALGRGDLLAASFGLALSALLVAGVQREGAQRAFLVMFGSAVFVTVPDADLGAGSCRERENQCGSDHAAASRPPTPLARGEHVGFCH